MTIEVLTQVGTKNILERRLGVSQKAIIEFCQRWQIIEFAVFGSVLRSDFRPDSDIDVLVTFAPEAKRGLTETLEMQDELKAMFTREVDFIIKKALEKSENWLRRQIILDSAQVIYATR
ncbi:nucleotidyltransferase family protein [Microcoleus sp.]|uniref:nucleotidyltransferase family protein n=1 Tax=Microcoleus sp. TaxID=44472 RepID=UPI003526AC30